MLVVKDINLYYGASQALRGVSVEAEIGRITCVLGRNGVGKSSLLRAIMGLQPIARGAISWEGGDISTAPSYERARRGIGYVPQGREIFGRLTVKENLETGFAALPSGKHTIPEHIYELFPVLQGMLRRRGG